MGLDKKASEYYSQEYGVPIEIRTKKRGNLSASAEVHAIVVVAPSYVPVTEQLIGMNNDGRDKLRHEKFVGLIEDAVDSFGHMYEREIIQHLANRDLRDMTKDWAATMGIPTPKVSVYDLRGKFAHFRVKGNTDTGTIVYTPRLLYFPRELVESVVVHELAHAYDWYTIYHSHDIYKDAAREWNVRDAHDDIFWDTLSKFMSDYDRKHRELQDMYQEIFEESAPPTD